MSIQVKYFAALRERMGRSDDHIDADGVRTVADVWARVAQDAPPLANVLVAVNMEHAAMDRAVRDGDEVAFFPPVTGG